MKERPAVNMYSGKVFRHLLHQSSRGEFLETIPLSFALIWSIYMIKAVMDLMHLFDAYTPTPRTATKSMTRYLVTGLVIVDKCQTSVLCVPSWELERAYWFQRPLHGFKGCCASCIVHCAACVRRKSVGSAVLRHSTDGHLEKLVSKIKKAHCWRNVRQWTRTDDYSPYLPLKAQFWVTWQLATVIRAVHKQSP